MRKILLAVFCCILFVVLSACGSKTDDPLISYSYQKHPISIKDYSNGDELITGNYFSVTLDEESAKSYPKLQSVIDGFNSGEESRLKEEIRTHLNDIIDIREQGFDGEGEVYMDYYPKRADGAAFSSAIVEYSFYGGAHGITQYYSYNYDPKTGDNIALSDVVKDTDSLPDIIVDELEKQNNDLLEFFKESPSDRDNLLKDIPGRIMNKSLVWALDYEGIWVYFEDYAMGVYAAGSQEVKIRFTDYPDLFTETYNNYTDKEIPKADEQAKQIEDAGITEISSDAM